MTVLATRDGLSSVIDGLGDELDRWHAPALQLVVVRAGEVVHADAHGVRGASDPVPVGPSTLFHHGSCGKAYTALAAAVLSDGGSLDLDAPVRRLVPELELPDAVLAERMTARDLLCHRSGLGRHDLAWILNPSWDSAELVRRLAHLPVAGDLRAEMTYSNLGYTLAGLAIGRAGGGTFASVLDDTVLRPAGLGRTTTSLATALADADHALPHLVRDGAPVPTPFRRLDGTTAAGQLLTPAVDAARWLMLQADGGVVAGTQVVPAAAVDATHRLHVAMPPELTPHEHLDLYGYGLGWVVSTYRGRPVRWHTGGVDGFFTIAFVFPDEHLGVLACVNLHMSEVARAAALTVVDAALGVGDGTPWFDRLRPVVADAPTPEPGPTGPPAHPFARYAGTYVDAGYGDLRVTVDPDLCVRIGETEVEAVHRSFDTWDLRYPPLDVEAPLTFVTGSDGVVAEVRIPLESPDEPVVFRRAEESP